MLDPHYRRHLQELHERIRWLRSLAPDSPRYRLWLGDLVEFVHAAHGADSAQMDALSAILQEWRPDPGADEDARRGAYLARLDAVDRLLDRWEEEAGR